MSFFLDPEYVSALFDGYSTRFESKLIDILYYKGHVLVYDSLLKTLKQMRKSPANIKTVVDLGCGTGLLRALIADEMPWVESITKNGRNISRKKEQTRK